MKNKYCSVCGKESSINNYFCDNCGKNIKHNKHYFSIKNIIYFITSVSLVFILGNYYQLSKLEEIELNISNNQFSEAQIKIEDISNIPIISNQSKISNVSISLNEKKHRVKQEIAKRKKQKNSSSSSSNSNNSKNNSNNGSNNNTKCLTNTVVYFAGPHTCEINQSLRIQRSGFDISTSTKGFGDPYASIYSYNSNCIKGNYSFSWTYYSQCVNFGKPDGPYSYTGTFYLDGKYKTYYVTLDYNGYPNVKGY